MVSSINLTYIRSQFQSKKRNSKPVLAKGGWSHHSEDQQDTYIDCLSSSGSFGRANQIQMPITTICFSKDPESDVGVSTTPVTVQPPPTQCDVVEYDTDGRPQHIYLPNTDDDDDDWSVSTLGSTIISDSRPGSSRREIPLTATFENLMIGTF